MRLIISLGAFLLSIGLFAQSEAPNNKKDTAQVNVVEKKPVFPGCEHLDTEEDRHKCFTIKIMKHIALNFKFPEEAREEGEQGMVIVNFTIEQDGSVSNVKIVQSVCPSIDEEAIRVIRMLPVMKQPAMQRGEPVRMSFNMPINASVNDPNKRW